MIQSHQTETLVMEVVLSTAISSRKQPPWEDGTEYGIKKAADMVTWFTSCGSETGLGAEAHLVQRFSYLR